ncbi:MAG: helix-turn-helix domain-containing protein [Chlamydiae bacterium CG10_big_fil_rev_8_21_14_0_10_42_34]|nr:MAG: helix-turn-helix domain-containing protein [Chlamydiae bacterium CG10_big_fil_rev_8_21_14_0_10_42_34]
MSEGLKKMGETFRSKREEMSLSLKEVENATSIRMIYLQAIEEGRVGHFLSNVYALGFIRQYASFLGIESDKLAKEFPEALRLPPEKQDFSYGIGTLEMRGSPHGGVRWIPNLIWGSLIVVMAICAWYFAKFVGLL